MQACGTLSRRIVSYRTRVSCVSCGLLAQNVGSGVMNAWNLSMDGAPMINRTCSAYPRWSAPVALYSRERGADERGEGRTRTHTANRSWKGMSSFDEFLPCASRRRALTNHSPVFTHICTLLRGAGGVLGIAYVRSCLRRDEYRENYSRVDGRRKAGFNTTYEQSVLPSFFFS